MVCLDLIWRFACQHAVSASQHIRYMSRTHFALREFVFALLSLAAGNFALLDLSCFDPWAPNDMSAYNYVGGIHSTGSSSVETATGKADDNGANESREHSVISLLVPAFCTGIHCLGVEPGSAPASKPASETSSLWADNEQQHMFWLCPNVLVHIDDETSERRHINRYDMLAAAIKFAHSRPTSSGSGEYHGRRTAFYVILLTLIEVQIAKVPPLHLAASDTASDCRGDTAPGPTILLTNWLPLYDPDLPRLSSEHPVPVEAKQTLAALVRICDDAIAMMSTAVTCEPESAKTGAEHDTPSSANIDDHDGFGGGGAGGGGSGSSSPTLPVEILCEIMSHADVSTFRACASTCTALYRFAKHCVRLDAARTLTRLRRCPVRNMGGQIAYDAFEIGAGGGSGGYGRGGIAAEASDLKGGAWYLWPRTFTGNDSWQQGMQDRGSVFVVAIGAGQRCSLLKLGYSLYHHVLEREGDEEDEDDEDDQGDDDDEDDEGDDDDEDD
jgi:hypothetical protein